MKIKPSVVFIKGGYVGVPVGFACRLLKITYVTHDSDAVPGLTNRLIAKKAAMNLVGMPPAFYPYPPEKINFVGVPVTDDYNNQEPGLRAKKRHELDVDKEDFLLLITGGSNGAQKLDKIVHATLEKLLVQFPRLHIVHQVGKNHEKLYEDYSIKLHSRIRVSTFLRPLSAYLAAADLVIARAGATAISEIGHIRKPLIVVPSAHLSGGHQTKNAELLLNANAAVVMNENNSLANPELLYVQMVKLIKSEDARQDLAQNLYKLTKKDAAKKISQLLIETGHKRKA